MEPHTWTHPTPRVRPDGTRIEEGDTFAPTENELRSWPERMEPVDDDGDDDSEPLVDREPEELSEAQRRIDGADYRTLQKVAGYFDEISAGQSTSDLRVALHTEADEDDVLDAFAAVNAEAEEDDTEDEES